MKLEAVTIPIEVRSVGECFDLALAFYRQHLGSILGLTSLFALPALASGYVVGRLGGHTLGSQLVIFALLSPILGACLVVAAGRRIFGEDFRIGPTFGHVLRRLPCFALQVILVRLGIAVGFFAAFLPALLVAVRWGFIPEVLYLEQVRFGGLERRYSAILSDAFGQLLGYALYLLVLTALVTLCLFTLADQLAVICFDVPIISDVMDWQDPWQSLLIGLEANPAAALTLAASLWLTFPLARIAWFLCYLDNRIRKEGWDLELLFRMESERLRRTAR